MFIGELYDFQADVCVGLLKRGSAINASACGTGKTVEMIAVCEYLFEVHRASQAVIFCRHAHEWARMIKQFSDSSVLVYSGTGAQRRNLRFDAHKHNYIVMSYGMVLQPEDISFLRKTVNSKTVLIVDEAHRIKSTKSRRSKALKGIGMFAGFRFALTATPVWNKADDLFGIAEWVDKDFFGPYFDFKEKYLITDYFGSIVGYKNLHELNELSKAILIRPPKEVVKAQLPSIVRKVIPVIPTAVHDKAMERVSSAIVRALDKKQEEGEWGWHKNIKGNSEVFNYMIALDRLSLSPQMFDSYAPDFLKGMAGKCSDSKIGYCVDIIQDIVSGGDSVVVFCRYIAELEMLQLSLGKYKSFILTGKMTKPALEDSLAEYNKVSKKEGCVLLSSDIGGDSINLPNTAYTINLDVPWGGADAEQRMSRIRRVDSTSSSLCAISLVMPRLDEYKYITSRWKEDTYKFILDGEVVDTRKPMLREYLTARTFLTIGDKYEVA